MLEVTSVAPETFSQYLQLILLLFTWLRPQAILTDTAVQFDAMLVKYFDHMFLSGYPQDLGSKTIAAVQLMWPELRHNLPRAGARNADGHD